MWANSLQSHHEADAATFVAPLCTSFLGAAEYLEGVLPGRHRKIMIFGMVDHKAVDIESDEDPNSDEDKMVARYKRLNALNSEAVLEYYFGMRSFGRFVSALEKQVPNVCLQTIDLSNVVWAGVHNSAFNEFDLEHLFTHVLPHHPTLKGIWLRPSIPTKYLLMLTSSIRACGDDTLLREICFTVEGHFNDEKARAIASMLRRDVPLTHLVLGGTLSATGCAMVCRAVAVNTNLQALDLLVTKTRADTLCGVLASSSLRTLQIRKRGLFAPECLHTFATELRSNTTLQALQFFRFVFNVEEARLFWRPLLHTLEYFNYSLVVVETGTQMTSSPLRNLLGNHMIIAQLLHRNGFIRRAIHALKTLNYQMPASILPLLFKLLSPIPGLLYHALRRVRLSKQEQ